MISVPLSPTLREADIPTDTVSLLFIGGIALAAFWLVFSLVRKVFGLVLIVALALGAWVVWSNPDMMASLWSQVSGIW